MALVAPTSLELKLGPVENTVCCSLARWTGRMSGLKSEAAVQD